MARLLRANRRLVPTAFVLHLQDALPDDYYVVSEPTVRRHELAAVLLGPRAVWVVHARDWSGTIRRGPEGWQAEQPDGTVLDLPDPMPDIQEAERALHDFLADDFPMLQPTVRHLLLLRTQGARFDDDSAPSLLVVNRSSAAERITEMDAMESDEQLPLAEREALALGLRDRHLSHTERAAEPFVFRSGGRRVWTIEALVVYMDQNPEDGIHHLRNGTVARWLAEQGAEHLAQLARTVLARRQSDPRVQLEEFLLGTGLVERPRLKIRPTILDFGYVLSGESATRRLTVRKGAGRGYLFGSAQATRPWIHLEPARFHDGALDAIVTVSTDELFINDQSHSGEILLHFSGTDDPVEIPVRLHVRGVPQPLEQHLTRPLAAMVMTGAPALLLGTLLGALGPVLVRWLPPLAALPAAAWLVGVLVLWLSYGLWRGQSQPAAWPTRFAIRRWLPRLLGWGVALATAVVGGLLLLAALTPVVIEPLEVLVLALFVFALAPFPAALQAAEPDAPPAPRPFHSAEAPRRSLARRLLRWSGAALVGFVFLIALWDLGLLDPNRASAPSLREWVAGQGARLESGLNSIVDDYYLRRYDRRAPER